MKLFSIFFKAIRALLFKKEQVINKYEPAFKEEQPAISNKNNKVDSLEYYKQAGIPSTNTTNEKIGQTSLMFTSRTTPTSSEESLEAAKQEEVVKEQEATKEQAAANAEDALGASLRYLKYQRWQNKQ